MGICIGHAMSVESGLACCECLDYLIRDAPWSERPVLELCGLLHGQAALTFIVCRSVVTVSCPHLSREAAQ